MKFHSALCLLSSALAGLLASTAFSLAGDVHVIEATALANWKSGTAESNGETPLTVEIKKGDMLDVDIPAGSGPHGFVTLAGKPADNPKPDLELVEGCGETKPAAVLKEVECPAGGSNFNKILVGHIKLEVLDTFSKDVNFWCVVHVSDMWGTLHLKS